ncbi:MAG TPA: NAD(P)H-binding protein [Chryseolinea sp.]|nr:NAD(P)H-binding protein [Chryseolinea sp.]HPM31755.1 NAD(P)H-binding protein [Chryseolinea sp.]
MKNYLITGSIGNISKVIVAELVKAGQHVSVITSSNERVKDIEKLGATALVGQVQDLAFLKDAFSKADVVYTMIPPIWQTTNWRKSQNEIAQNYTEALRSSKVKYVVNLSSIGAHLKDGVGPINGLYDFEQMLNTLSGLNVKNLRPSYFYFNLLAQIGMIKQAGIMGGNFGDQEKVFLVHPKDIAAAAIEELLHLDFNGNSIRYVIGDERSGAEIAKVLGKSINKDLNWVTFSDEQQKSGLLGAGLPDTHASAYTEMGNALRVGTMQADARAQKLNFSEIKLEDFAVEFAKSFSA